MTFDDFLRENGLDPNNSLMDIGPYSRYQELWKAYQLQPQEKPPYKHQRMIV